MHHSISGRVAEIIRWPSRKAIHPSRRAEPQHLGGDGDVDRTGGDELVGEARQQSFDRLLAAGQDHVEVIALGYPGTVGRVAGDGVALDDRDPFEVAGQRLGGEQAGHAGAEHDGVVVPRKMGIHPPTMRRGTFTGTSGG